MTSFDNADVHPLTRTAVNAETWRVREVYGTLTGRLPVDNEGKVEALYSSPKLTTEATLDPKSRGNMIVIRTYLWWPADATMTMMSATVYSTWFMLSRTEAWSNEERLRKLERWLRVAMASLDEAVGGGKIPKGHDQRAVREASRSIMKLYGRVVTQDGGFAEELRRG